MAEVGVIAACLAINRSLLARLITEEPVFVDVARRAFDADRSFIPDCFIDPIREAITRDVVLRAANDLNGGMKVDESAILDNRAGMARPSQISANIPVDLNIFILSKSSASILEQNQIRSLGYVFRSKYW